MCDTAGELPDRFHLLALPQGFLGQRAFVDFAGDALFQCGVEVAKALLACAQLLEAVARIVLATAPAQGRLDEADERRRVERPLEERDVAQCA